MSKPDPSLNRYVTNKVTELSDYSVCTTWGIRSEFIFLLYVVRLRLNYPELKRAVRQQWQEYQPSVVLIEDKASGTQIIQGLLAEGLYGVTRYAPEQDKTMRLHPRRRRPRTGSFTCRARPLGLRYICRS